MINAIPKLICSDLDGTLVPYGKPGVEEELYGQIEALAAHGILFCPASGRQYTSMKKMFAPVAAQCAFVCENGGVIFKDGALLCKTPMPRALATAVAWDMWNNTDEHGEIMLSGGNTSYLMVRSGDIVKRIEFIGNNYKVITDPAQIEEDIIKVSVYLKDGVGPYVERIVPKWKDANAAVAGPLWIDTTIANKGKGVAALCAALGIAPGEVLAFGDNYNDVSMLDFAGAGYIMDNAAPELRARYTLHTDSPVSTLRALLAELDAR